MTPSARVARAGYVLAAAAAAGTLFLFAPRTDAIRFVAVTLPVVAVLLAVAAAGVLGSRTGRPVLHAVSAGIALVAAVLQQAQFGRDPNWLGGNGSTASFLGALGLGYAGLWVVARAERRADRPG